ncbi:Uncharacterised protein [Achromobacter xylosoxidans]|nr:Uncharacterised protein [Achromobacter xylosoxidans]CUJ37666.1 Uncharacterised protein [Achromobacter xylosoxidans]CUJ57250.1 Uncharacterised protein [Achromobacter xylosoxidans]
MPDASDFFDPQNTSVISFSLDSPSLRLPQVVTSSTDPSSNALTSTMVARSIAGNACQMPCATASLNAV